jgi:hypothetical protein
MNDHFVKSFNESVEAAEVFLSIVRDSDLQRDACASLQSVLSQIASEKAEAVSCEDEAYANLLLGCECVADALIAELRMWLALKEEKPDDAWDQLISAQEASGAAVRAHDSFAHLEQHKDRLEAIERLVFPPQVFVSSGFVLNLLECSICGREYEDCEHLIGKPYMGRFCYGIGRKPRLEHVAIVEHPADKRCRVTSFAVDGGTRDRMTWRIEPIAKGT